MKKRKLRKGIALKLALLAALFVVATLGTAFGVNYLFNRPQEEKKNEEPEVVATPTPTRSGGHALSPYVVIWSNTKSVIPSYPAPGISTIAFPGSVHPPPAM